MFLGGSIQLLCRDFCQVSRYTSWILVALYRISQNCRYGKQVDMSWCCFGARGKHISHSQQDTGTSLQHIKLFTYSELRSATDNFHPSTKIGRGGFGIVYKGILRDGTPIAAKVLSAESGQGINEFLTEIDVITNVKHPSLVELLGCCVQGSNRILVYEYVENSSLDRALLGSRSEPANLNWAIRSEICVGTARGLAFLHEELQPHIVHRDIKASNILLGKNYAPKIGDFGLAKLFPDNVTHISTRVAGTTGYLAPEYAMRGQLTKKADVYSFGVLVLEIVSGRSSSLSSWSEMDKFLLEWAWQLFKEGRLTELVDPALTEYPEEEVIRYMKVALFCTQAASSRRPTMSKVVEMLSRPLRLKDEALTPPGLVTESTWKKSSEDTGSGSSLIKDSSSAGTTATFNSTPATFTEFIPR